MKKDFEKWHKKKGQIHDSKERPYFHEAEVWFASVGLNIGSEQDGVGRKYLRPVLVLKKFNEDIFIGVPLTKKHKKGKYYFEIVLKNRGTNCVLLSQV